MTSKRRSKNEKVVYLKPEFKHHKPKPICPLTRYHALEPCLDLGISFKPSTSTYALDLAKTSHRALQELSVLPREIIIIDYAALYAPIQIHNAPCILPGTIDLLPTLMIQIDKDMTDKQISCYNLTVYYSLLWPEIFVHWENLHDEEAHQTQET